MTCKSISACIAIAVVCGSSASALAAFSPGMRSINSDPATWGGFTVPIASLDAQSFGYNYPAQSGFAWEFLGNTQDRTDVRTDVYRFTAGHTFNPGGGAQEYTATAGDLVFAYRLTLVEANALTVTSLKEAQVIGAPLFGFGVDAMLGSSLKAQGFVTTSHGRDPVLGNVSDSGAFGASLDFEWGGGLAQNLVNDQSITMLMFTNPANVGRGVINLIAPAGQLSGVPSILQGNAAPPVLIPIIPSPGALGLLSVGFGMIAARRRGRA